MGYESPVVYNLDSDSGNGGSGSGCGWGGGWDAWIVIILFALIFGWGNGGWGNSGTGGNSTGTQAALTRGELCQDMNFQDVKNGVEGTRDAVANGFANLNSTICSQQYDTAQMVNGLGTTVMQGFNTANITALQGQNAIQTQLAQCCCENREGQAQIRYDMATNTCALQNTIQTGFRDAIDATNAGTRAILDYLCQEKISGLQAENQALRLTASQTAQTQNIVNQLRPFPVAAYQVCNPFTGTYGGYQSYGSACGCNTGCGC